jgi:Protein of unknown function (DUF2934)
MARTKGDQRTATSVQRTATSNDRALKPRAQPAIVNSDVARLAYDLYLTRGCEHGHDLEDWFQAERELQDAVRSTEP